MLIAMKKSIHEIAAEVLQAEGKPMTADEIYSVISSKNLYEFKAQSPRGVVRSQLRRHSANISGPNQAKDQKFNLSPDGKFSLLK